MTKWIELREKIRKIYGKHNRLILAVVKFILALFLFLLINHSGGYMEKLHHVYIAVALALICAMLPVNMTVLLAAVFTVVHLYALSMEVAVTALLIFLLMFFLYFRFSPKNGYEVVLMPITFVCRIPYAVPVANGLIGEPSSMISVIFGTILYYFLNGIHNNASLLKGVQGGESADNKFVVSLNQVLANKEMYLVILAFCLAVIVVYNIRRRAVEYAWSIAIGAGILTEFIVLCVGYLVLGISGRILWLVFGSILSTGIGFLIEFLCFNLDYSRTEKVQFEDDEYYYYVKAVPKVNLSSKEKQIKKISGKKNAKRSGERITKKQLAKELDIQEDMLD